MVLPCTRRLRFTWEATAKGRRSLTSFEVDGGGIICSLASKKIRSHFVAVYVPVNFVPHERTMCMFPQSPSRARLRRRSDRCLILDSINHKICISNEDRGALRGTPGSAYPQPEPNATELPSSAPGRPELIELQASAPSPTPTRAEEHIATTPDCRPRAPAPSPTPTRAGHLSGLQIVRLRALARRRAPKRTPHYTCRCERGTLHMKRWECLEHGRPQPRCCRCR